MDLSFSLPDPAAASPLPAAEAAPLALLLGEARIAPAPTAIAAAGDLLAPVHGAFNAAMAARLIRWQRP